MRARATLGLGTAAALTALIAACSSSTDAGAGSATDGGADSPATETAIEDGSAAALEVSIHAVFDLPRSLATQSLSATAYDPDSRSLLALQDLRPNIVPLVASEDFTTFTVGALLPLTGRALSAWDGEGLVRSAGGFIAVTVETTPTVERFDATGLRTGAVTMPAHFAKQGPNNKGLESLAISPDGTHLFTANESALAADGAAATKSRGTTVRILRRELASDTDLEVAYRTEPLGAGGATGDMGVSELAALSNSRVLVLERGFQPGYGNTVRVFRVDVTAGDSVLDVASLSDATPVLAKTLVVDVGSLPAGSATHPQQQPNPILDNYESIALGPTLADGRRLVFLTSDDNASASQVARVLVLAVRGL